MAPSAKSLELPTSDDDKRESSRSKAMASRLALLRRPLRLRGNSTVSVPLGVVLVFPVFILILILILFVRHPSSAGRLLAPAGAPPAIRYGRPESLRHATSLSGL